MRKSLTHAVRKFANKAAIAVKKKKKKLWIEIIAMDTKIRNSEHSCKILAEIIQISTWLARQTWTRDRTTTILPQDAKSIKKAIM